MTPETKYTRAGDIHIAYQVLGDGPLDLVVVPGFVSHLEMAWEAPPIRRFAERLATFSRVILFDKRGTGLSDHVEGAPTLEERMDDVRAVMDAAGSERAAILGMSEGAPMAILFAASYPERVQALVLYGGMARATEAPDYPWAPPLEAIMEAAELIGDSFYEGASVEIFAPSLADDPGAREFAARFMRNAARPAMFEKLSAMFVQIDVRAVLPAIAVPTLVLHRRGDRVVSVHAGRYLAEHIAGARFVELSGPDHQPWAGDQATLLDEVEEFLTGTIGRPEPDRILANVMFTDIVGSTERAATIGDGRWRDLLEAHDSAIASELSRAGGRIVKSTGDGCLAVFDGPARAIRCGQAIIPRLRALDIDVRVGIHTGECEIVENDLAGVTVHIAARVASLADVGEVLVSRTVKDLVAGSGILFADRGTHTLKGVPDTWQLYAAEVSPSG